MAQKFDQVKLLTLIRNILAHYCHSLEYFLRLKYHAFDLIKAHPASRSSPRKKLFYKEKSIRVPHCSPKSNQHS